MKSITTLGGADGWTWVQRVAAFGERFFIGIALLAKPSCDEHNGLTSALGRGVA